MTNPFFRRVTAFLIAAAVAVTPGWADEAAQEPATLTPDCRSAILMEQSTGKILYEQNADEPMPPASITKIMTLLLVFDAMQAGRFDYSTALTCSAHAASMGGSQIWLEEGESMTVDELLRATFISSANDAAVMLAEAVAGTEQAFVAQMNARAAELGMNGTLFQNATGLDAPEHYSTARDIAVMSAALLSYEDVPRYSTVWMDSLRQGATQLVNTNKLVRFYDGTTGLKTGTTDGAGSCLSASARRNGMSLIAVSLGSDTSVQRFNSCRAMLDFGFANYVSAPPPSLAGELLPLPVAGGIRRQVEVCCELPQAFILEKGEQEKLSHRLSMAESVEAPVAPGQKVGEVIVEKNGEKLGVFPVVTADSVEKMRMGDALRVFFLALLGQAPQF